MFVSRYNFPKPFSGSVSLRKGNFHCLIRLSGNNYDSQVLGVSNNIKRRKKPCFRQTLTLLATRRTTYVFFWLVMYLQVYITLPITDLNLIKFFFLVCKALFLETILIHLTWRRLINGIWLNFLFVSLYSQRLQIKRLPDFSSTRIRGDATLLHGSFVQTRDRFCPDVRCHENTQRRDKKANWQRILGETFNQARWVVLLRKENSVFLNWIYKKEPRQNVCLKIGVLFN